MNPLAGSSSEALAVIRADRALTVVRAPEIPDPVALAEALAGNGIRAVELTFTTLGVLDAVAKASAVSTAVVGVGTVTTRAQAEAAIEVGARFLVTPALRPEVAEVAVEQQVPVIMGALTPSEVLTAVELGAAAVKIFPARALGPDYLKDLLGPFPHVFLIPSGGVNARNARDFLRAGAFAVTAGTEVVAPQDVANARWSHIGSRAARFVHSLD
ncbi:bifunctional 4-hydroxy-2-oxoglutarate aldolase/2-dehydro-3-deoxy-phosphogluconate aldolase [Nocardia asteroides NBRC 15531]|uniref:4-hydroxy-2-oxoglutarate/2-dehydro-3-deoxy-phosphogluconate aldolase n=1 Tax=Nocardia asteroides NBRC 15531 TaxID=1110697 RepID=U5EMQ1_NOCAS|nr:bifunctional 4-hydroxy-2-oxoglutarate aldolase/2-dehydro-3-deoxy-phosphogluconate aldolase [Nocardia asteroides]TLF62807.1 bifunctional 4-hydroxy-2-oxoglutarate aldolase/2-dehydro-3-deoxy-phosphogluconate aldolase [Nocardia asteroides NBRC 15531]UGT46463.1 bifunctional 4-hydroxy-2-oxoglutarate aldolase/2-dehydro-3-deoxy-phosphogluconate aldolase [Nocardia asteroides]SFN55934.1 2-dehydro-3-deoxyphosphogluconate aldolase / (4S)-4-hydroxy-2-oxoglutarate aldolase [Nocardia asteroides]VEG34714.1 